MSKSEVQTILEAINDFRAEVREVYVTKAEFAPVKGIVFGMVTIILSVALYTILKQIGVNATL